MVDVASRRPSTSSASQHRPSPARSPRRSPAQRRRQSSGSLDLQDAYLQVPVHPESRKYQHFCLCDKVYQFWVQCFGLSSAPQVFTHVMAQVSSIMHRFGFRILRYLDDWLVLGSSLSEIVWARDFLLTLLRARDTSPPSQELSHSISETRLSGDDAAVFYFEGFPNPSPCAESALSRRQILILARAAAQSLEVSFRSNVFSLHSHSGLTAPDARTPTSSSGVSASGVSGRARLLGRLLPEGSSVVVRSLPSGRRGQLSSSPSRATSVYRRVRCRVGRISRLRPPVRLVVSRCFSIFDQPPRTSGSLPCHPGFSPSPLGQVSVSLHRQYVHSFIPPQGRGHSFFDPQRRGSGNSSSLRVQRCASAPPVCPRSPQRLGRLSVVVARSSAPSGFSTWMFAGAFPPLAGDGGFVRHIPQPSPPGVLFAHGRPPAGSGQCLDLILGSFAGLCLPSLWPHPEGTFQGSRLPQSGADLCGSLLATPALVSGPPRSSSGGPSPSASTSGSSPSAPLPSVPPEPPCAGADWVSHCQRSARHFGFSARVARQLAFSRRPSTRLNYQS